MLSSTVDKALVVVCVLQFLIICIGGLATLGVNQSLRDYAITQSEQKSDLMQQIRDITRDLEDVESDLTELRSTHRTDYAWVGTLREELISRGYDLDGMLNVDKRGVNRSVSDK
jgi:dimeric dUTPase (all-alpha-NTP-PPase superfamily)